jgi:peptidoglycan/LPS O-acetylase OafA/YrhL
VWLPGGAVASHCPALDGLRGIAILGVMLYHFGGMVNPVRFGNGSLEGIRSFGWAGVDLFFVLSGFLITGILWNARGTTHYYRNFYARRALRIFPLYYGILAVIAFIAALIPHPAPATLGLRSHQPWLWLYGTNLLMASTGMQLKTNWCDLGHFWSLAVEEQFYLVWPMVVACCSAARLKQVSMAVIAGALLSRIILYPLLGSRVIYLLTFCRMDALAMGALLFLILREAGANPRTLSLLHRIFVGCLLLLAVLVIGRGGLHHNDYYIGTLGFSLVAVVAAGCVLEAILFTPKQTVLAKALAATPLVWLGRYSYGIYAIHGVLRPYFLAVLLRLGSAMGNYPAAVFCFLLLGLGVSSLLGWASYHLWEAPFLRLKGRFAG